jgi:hypothetical protein
MPDASERCGMSRRVRASTATSTRQPLGGARAGAGAWSQPARLEGRCALCAELREPLSRRDARRPTRAFLQRHPLSLRVPLTACFAAPGFDVGEQAGKRHLRIRARGASGQSQGRPSTKAGPKPIERSTACPTCVCSRMPPSRTVAPYPPAWTPKRRGGHGSRAASGLFHKGYQPPRALQRGDRPPHRRRRHFPQRPLSRHRHARACALRWRCWPRSYTKAVHRAR